MAENGRSVNCQRFAPSSAKLLQRWFSSHSHHPYPTEDEKAMLQGQTGLSTRQISTWFANTRRRSPSKVARSLLATSALGSISVPDVSSTARVSDMNPLDRWRNSPPDQDGPSLNAIVQAANTGNLQHSPSYDGIGDPQLLALHARSEASNDSWNSSSGDSSSSANSFASFGRNSPHRRPRRRRNFAKPQSAGPQKVAKNRIFQCTFCTDTFKSKYDWTRHESTLHLVLEKWTCAPFGPKYHKPGEEVERCVFCDEMDPTDIHLSSHEYEVCQSKPIFARTFYRKDHLQQHLRIIHKVNEFQSSILNWKIKITQTNCRCGFCGEQFRSWLERNEHIADHFREGALMKDWKGCRGLDPAVALHVQNAMPPYLIATESNEFEPFSASRATSKEPYSNPSNQNAPTIFENLTARLTEYVRSALQAGTLITDDTVRKQARLIMFGDDDAWNQTPADNSEWLRLFKNGLGLGINRSSICTNRTSELAPLIANHGQNSLQHTTTEFPNSSLLPSEPAPLYQDFLQQGCKPSQIGINANEFQLLPLAWQTPECLAEFRRMQEDSLPTTEALSPSCATASACSQGIVPAIRSEQQFVANFSDEDLNSFIGVGSPQMTGNDYNTYPSVDDLVFPFDFNFDESVT